MPSRPAIGIAVSLAILLSSPTPSHADDVLKMARTEANLIRDRAIAKATALLSKRLEEHKQVVDGKSRIGRKGEYTKARQIDIARQRAIEAGVALKDACLEFSLPVDDFDPQRGHVGSYGTVHNVKVLEVIGDSKARVRYGYLDFLLIGVTTKDWAEGQRHALDRPMLISKTEKYLAGLLGERTLMVMEPFDTSTVTKDWRADGEKRWEAWQKRTSEALGQVREKREDKEPVSSDPDADATRKLHFAEDFLASSQYQKAIDRLEEVVKKYPGTAAAQKAAELLPKARKLAE